MGKNINHKFSLNSLTTFLNVYFHQWGFLTVVRWQVSELCLKLELFLYSWWFLNFHKIKTTIDLFFLWFATLFWIIAVYFLWKLNNNKHNFRFFSIPAKIILHTFQFSVTFQFFQSKKNFSNFKILQIIML